MSRIRDIIHGYIAIDDEDQKLLNSPLIQRLRYIRQNDLDFLVFPTLNTSRFEHSLGVMHLAGKMAVSALSNAPEEVVNVYFESLWNEIDEKYRKSKSALPESFRRAARWYGLLHDVGHLPFSHLTERAVEVSYSEKEALHGLYGDGHAHGFEKLHEAAGHSLVREGSIASALKTDPQAAWIVEQLMSGKAASDILKPLKDILDSEIDADRIDSTARDGYLSGGDFGNYDTERLVQSAHLVNHEKEWRILFSTRAIGPIEGLLIERYKTHRWIHYHPKVMALKNAFRYCISNLGWDVQRWGHTKYYDSRNGFFDDAAILRALWEIDEDKNIGPLKDAREAILLRTDTASPLWKRTDEFHEMCAELVKLNPDWGAGNHVHPVLNRIGLKTLKSVEDRLNVKPPAGIHFLIGKSTVKLVDLRQDGELIYSDCLMRTESGAVTPLTQQSGLVANLHGITRREPSVSVCVLGKVKSETHRKELQQYFVKIAFNLLKEDFPPFPPLS